MAELYANAFATTLVASCSDSGLTISVGAAAPAALQGGQFRIAIDAELLLVTAGQSGTTWTVTRGVEGTTAAAHAGGAAVTHVLTAAGLLTSPFFNVRAFGAKGDVTDDEATDLSPYTDDTAAIQSAIDAATGGGTVYFPAGTYRVDGALSVVANGVTLLGAGRVATKLQTTSRTNDLITVEAHHFGLASMSLSRAGLTATGGSGLYLKSGTHARIDNVSIAGTSSVAFYDLIKTLNASGWVLTDALLSDAVRYGVYVRNADNPDTGDSTILGCQIATQVASAAAVRIESSGGLRIVDNKIASHGYGIDLQVADGASTAVLVVTGNSMEIPTTANIRLGRLGTTGLYGSTVITGNQMSGSVTSDGIVIGPGVYNSLISGNVMTGHAGHAGVDVIANADQVGVLANTFADYGTGIRMANSASKVNVGVNQFTGVAVTVEDNVYDSYAQGLVTHDYRRYVTALTDSSTYRDVIRLDFDSVTGCRLDLVMEGTLDWSTGIVRAISKTIHRGAGGNCTLTAISDTAGGTAIDVNLDTTTTAGSVIVQVRRNSGAGGARVDGALALHLMGHVQKVNIL